MTMGCKRNNAVSSLREMILPLCSALVGPNLEGPVLRLSYWRESTEQPGKGTSIWGEAERARTVRSIEGSGGDVMHVYKY